ncbi:MAG: DUF5011 domain-containing protein [Erysipelotrichaceae bacterium]|nr:DUF5011 domain-containing protein [Erysipelotrichaceae bacterium]
MNKYTHHTKIILVSLLIFSLYGCTTSVKLLENEIEIYEGQTINPHDYLSEDYKDDSNVIIENKVNTAKAGDYEIIYKIKDKETVLKVKVLSDPITINAENLVIELGTPFNPKDYISNEDKANDILITNNVDINKHGEYIVIYSFAGLEKELKVSVKEVEIVLNQSSVEINLGSTFDPRTYLSGAFPLSTKITIDNPVDTSKIGKYNVKYLLGSESKTLSVTVKDVSPILISTSISIKQGSVFNPVNYLIESDRTNASIEIDNNVDVNTPGTYSVTYTLDTVVKTLNVTVTKVEVVASYTLKVISLTSPISAGSYATIVVQGKADKEYSIAVYYKSGASTAAGLEDMVADSSGQVSWTWKVGTRTTPGSWKIVITGDGKTTSTYIKVT